MSSSGPELRPLARRVALDDDELRVDLADGRRIVVPLTWFPRLMAANAAARAIKRTLNIPGADAI